jgi:signal transduction histidine kinase
MDLLAELQQIEHFHHVPAEQLAWLLAHAEPASLAEGELLFGKGDPIDHAYVFLAGRVHFYVVQEGQRSDLLVAGAGQITGRLPYSRMGNSVAEAVAEAPLRFLRLHRDHFPEMIRDHYALTEGFVHAMTSRVRETTRLQQQNEKMVSLGKLSAGLAHELNNPAAAMARSASALKKNLSFTPDRFKKVMAIQLSSQKVDYLNQLMYDHIAQGQSPTLSMLARSQREDELLDFLEDNGVADAMDLAPPLADFGFTEADLATMREVVGQADLEAVISWVVNNLVTERTVSEIEQVAQRIAQLTGAIKSYSYMDRDAGLAPTDLREGLQSTLVLLGHKLKAKQIELTLDIPPDMPPVPGYGGELNQVWTNLIDNALDALPHGGHLHIRTWQERGFALAEVMDNGPGIPPSVINQIFDPFFTTKPVGQGTGLGLDIVQKIVRHHRGKITVTSEPGRTVFQVCLPLG